MYMNIIIGIFTNISIEKLISYTNRTEIISELKILNVNYIEFY